MVKTISLTKLSNRERLAYMQCQAIANTYYENFPVASYLLPKHLRRSIAAIYAFARTADNIADEGQHDQDTRLELMTRLESNLYDIQYGKPPTDALFVALKHTIESYHLPIQLFYDLLTAHRQDILKDRYNNFGEVKDYCHYSANPIGRLFLHMTGQANRENIALSDQICTGLQLINFLQDIVSDLKQKNRCYIPLDELAHYNVELSDIAELKLTENYQALISKQLQRAMEIYKQGMALGQLLPGFFGLEIRFIIGCGQKILQKLASREDPFARPIMTRTDMLLVLGKSMFNKHLFQGISEPVLDKL